MNLLCRLFGHKVLHAFDGSLQCKRCRERYVPTVDPSKEVPSIAQLSMHDPEWMQRHGNEAPYFALVAFRRRNPNYSEPLNAWMDAQE